MTVQGDNTPKASMAKTMLAFFTRACALLSAVGIDARLLKRCLDSRGYPVAILLADAEPGRGIQRFEG